MPIPIVPYRHRIASICRLTLGLVGLALIQGCASGVRREMAATKVGLAYSKSCSQLIVINPDHKTFYARTRRSGPIPASPTYAEDKAADGQVPSPAEARMVDEVGAEERVCELREADTMQPTAPLVAALLRTASAARHAVFDQLAAGTMTWAEARQQLWYIHDSTAIKLVPMLTELNENNRSRMEADALLSRFASAALVGAAAGAASGVTAYHPPVRSFARVR